MQSVLKRHLTSNLCLINKLYKQVIVTAWPTNTGRDNIQRPVGTLQIVTSTTLCRWLLKRSKLFWKYFLRLDRGWPLKYTGSTVFAQCKNECECEWQSYNPVNPLFSKHTYPVTLVKTQFWISCWPNVNLCQCRLWKKWFKSFINQAEFIHAYSKDIRKSNYLKKPLVNSL